ncbi:hypothetical protein OY671_008889, partial [Metschnikowia pulcherrima]
MKDSVIAGTQSTPANTADGAAGVSAMRGDSYPENSFESFGPVIEWVEAYSLSSAAPSNSELESLYSNTSSIKSVMDIFDVSEAAHGKGRSVSVTWFYDMRNERVGESAEEFKEDCSFPFSVSDDRIVGLSADPAYAGHPLREALQDSWRHTAEQMARIERVTHLSDAYQSMAHQREMGSCEQFDRQSRRSARIARISDHYQSMMRDSN